MENFDIDVPKKYMPIQIQRVIEKLDEYLNRNDMIGAEKHILYWINEAKAGCDERGELSMTNELIGLYRKIGNAEGALVAIRDALRLVDTTGLNGTITAGTTFVNAATAYKAFDYVDEAMPLYERAQTIYEKELESNDTRLGALYNNMAITLMEKGEFESSREYFAKALKVMEQNNRSELESAITYCNLADLATREAESKMEGSEAEDFSAKINEYLDKAEALFDTEGLVRDGYYAFVAEKCAPAFGHFGREKSEKKLLTRAQIIRENNK